MHVVPESSVLTQSEDTKEENAIIDIALKMPIDTYVFVKENIEMVGFRPFSFYKKLSEIHNIVLIDPMYNSLELIKKSRGLFHFQVPLCLKQLWLIKER